MTESLSWRMTSRIRTVWRDWSGATRARLVFVLVAGTLMGLYDDPFSTGALTQTIDSYLRLYAAAAGAILHLIDPAVLVSGDTIEGLSAMKIVRGCDAAEMMILYAAGVVATLESPWPRRAVGLAAGWALIVFANIARLRGMYYLIKYAPSAQDVFHYEVFPLTLVALTLGVYVVWRRGFGVPRELAPAGAAS